MTGVVHGWRSSELWAVLKNLPARPSAALDSLIRRGLKMAEQRERRRMRSRDIKVLSVAFSWFGFSRPLSKWAFKKVRGCVMGAVLHERSVELLAFFGNTHTHRFGVDFSCNVAVRQMQEHLAWSNARDWSVAWHVRRTTGYVGYLFVDWRQISAIICKVCLRHCFLETIKFLSVQ